MQLDDTARAEYFVDALLRDPPAPLRLLTLFAARGCDTHEPAAAVRTRALREQARVNQRTKVARQGGRPDAHFAGEVDRSDRPELDDIGQQRILRAFQADLADLRVVVLRHAAHQLAQLDVGAAL